MDKGIVKPRIEYQFEKSNILKVGGNKELKNRGILEGKDLESPIVRYKRR